MNDINKNCWSSCVKGFTCDTYTVMDPRDENMTFEAAIKSSKIKFPYQGQACIIKTEYLYDNGFNCRKILERYDLKEAERILKLSRL